MKLDKFIFTHHNHDQASDHQSAYRKMSPEERSEAFFYLMQVAYGFVGNPWPKMDKHVFKINKK
jgi:hypothetical protein